MIQSSHEEATQGDPLASSIYAIATIPLIKKLDHGVTQVWYADDATYSGTIGAVREWWE